MSEETKRKISAKLLGNANNLTIPVEYYITCLRQVLEVFQQFDQTLKRTENKFDLNENDKEYIVLNTYAQNSIRSINGAFHKARVPMCVWRRLTDDSFIDELVKRQDKFNNKGELVAKKVSDDEKEELLYLIESIRAYVKEKCLARGLDIDKIHLANLDRKDFKNWQYIEADVNVKSDVTSAQDVLLKLLQAKGVEVPTNDDSNANNTMQQNCSESA